MALDVNAIMVSTGQTIWFYRWVKTEPQRQDNNIMALAVEAKSNQWVPVNPQRRAVAEKVAVVRSAEVEAVSRSGRSADEEKALYFQLLRSVVSDFVKEFSGGRNVAAIPLPPRPAPAPVAIPPAPPPAAAPAAAPAPLPSAPPAPEAAAPASPESSLPVATSEAPPAPASAAPVAPSLPAR